MGEVASSSLAQTTILSHQTDALFDWLASQCDRRDQAWDCATGTGQAATGIAPHFRHVYATDSSAGQIVRAEPASNITYAVAPAESCGLSDCSVDLITVAQALHWFDRDRFFAEVQRIARPRALLAVYGYSWFYLTPSSTHSQSGGCCSQCNRIGQPIIGSYGTAIELSLSPSRR